MKTGIITVILLNLALIGFSQTNGIGYEVRGTYMRPVVKKTLNDARTLSDINPGYPASWVSKYLSVQILATCNGIVMKAMSANDTLNEEQLGILKMADIGTDVIVDVTYNSKNALTEELDIKVINFTYGVVPHVQAVYPEGYQRLREYIKRNAIDNINAILAMQIQMASVSFTVDEEGNVIDAQVSKTTEDVKTDELLLETIRKMPKWKPAEDHNGVKVKQKFELTIGNVGC